MKILLLTLLLLTGLTTGCRKTDPVGPDNGQPGEVAALLSVNNLAALADCTCCSAYSIRIGDDVYGANQLPDPYTGADVPVWIRYSIDQAGGCSQTNRKITVSTIRSRHL